MRQIGKLPPDLAPEPFHDHLLTLGVKSRIDPGPDGQPIWVYDEDKVQQARDELALYLADPQNPRYQTAQSIAQTVRDRERSLDKAYRKNYREVTDLWAAPRLHQRPLTMALIAISIVVFMLEQTRYGNLVARRLLLSTVQFNELGQERDDGLAGVFSGELWRLITPIFVHVNLLHIFFNMSAMSFMGTLIEIRRGSGRLLLLVLVSAVISNLGQYYYMEHVDPGMPHRFAGMSGVAYALFGYLWMKSLHQPEQGMILHPNTVLIMLGWLVLCMTGALGSVANAAHVMGLVVGVVLGVFRL